jgi:streptogramin lyase
METKRSYRHAVCVLAVCACVLAGAAISGAAPLGTITEFTAVGSNIAQVRAGPDGNLWFTDRAGRIGQITTSGAITEYSTGLNAGSQPFSLAVGPDGNLWFTDAGATSAIGMIDPATHAIAEFSAGLNAGSKPAGITLGPDGNLWFTDGTSAIGTINPTTHAISEFSAGLNAGSAPQQGITTGPDGNVWFTDRGTTRAVGMINPATHAISEFSSGLNAGSAPGAAITVGTDGNLWFVDPGTTGAIGTIDPTTHAIAELATGAGSAPGRIAVGPDGNLWFTDKGVGVQAIASLDPTTHAITKYSSGLNAASAPGGINTGPDGNVWFTDQGTTRAMGRVGTGAAVALVTTPSVDGTGGVNVAQTCGGDTWSTWAGRQPSRDAFGFDGYVWLLDGVPVAAGSSYTPTTADAGHQLSCVVTATYPLLDVTASATSDGVRVKGAADQLSELADAVDGIGPGASLAHKVAAVESYAAEGDTADACAALVTFRNEVSAQTGKKLGSEQAESLLDRAQDIEAALGC